jgi:hypothetical protein
MESDTVLGGHLALDISFIYKTTATRDRFRVQLLEYDSPGGSLISTLDIADYAAGANISTDAIGLDINGLIGNSDYYALKFILGDAGSTTTAGSVDIDAIGVKSRADIISKTKFNAYADAIPNADNESGFIYIPSGITTIATDVFVQNASSSVGTASGVVTINGTAGASTPTAAAGASKFGTATVTLSAPTLAALPGIFTYVLSTTAGRDVTATTLFSNTQGFKTGLVYA